MPSDPKDRPFFYRKASEQQSRDIRAFMCLFERVHIEMAACGEASREKSLAMTKLEEAAMWMNKHIALRTGAPEEGPD